MLTTVVDTSAVVVLLLGEAGSDAIQQRLLDDDCVMSAATRVELGIVIEVKAGPDGAQLLEELLRRVGMTVVSVDEDLAADALACWRRFGKGRHPAGLNFGDTFSYALAKRLGQPLLFVGNDFAQTDITRP